MLQKMRDQTQSLGFKVLVAILVVVLAVFGFGAFNLFVTGDPEVASVDGEGITEGDLARATERERRRMAAQMGEDFDPSTLDSVELQGAVLEQLISREILEQAAEDFGVGASSDQVNRTLVEAPSFQVDGTFQPDMYRQAVRAMGYSPQEFMEETAQLLALDQMQSTLTETALLTDRELDLHVRLLAQSRDLAYLPFPVAAFRDEVDVSDEDVRLRYQEDQRAYTTDETADAAYVVLSIEDLLDDPAIEVTESDLREAYAAERENAPAEEERRSRHILLSTGEQRSAEEARAALEDIRARVLEGESFAAIAEEVSEDPGSASQGGDLGFAGRGVFEPAFEEALFALEEPGAVSRPVQTEYGYHLIMLEDVRRSELPSFDERREALAKRLRREQAEELYEERLRELDNLAFEHPNSLDQVVSELGLERKTVDGVTREEGPAPFDQQEVREALFGSEVLDQGFNSPAIELDEGRAVVVRATEHHPPEPVPFEAVASEIRDAMETERARALARDARASATARLEAGESVAEVAADYESSWQTFEGVRRSSAEVPQTVIRTAFDLPRPGDSGKSLGEVALPAGDPALVVVTRVRAGDPEALPEAERASMRRFLEDRVARVEFDGFFESLRAEASVHRADRR